VNKLPAHCGSQASKRTLKTFLSAASSLVPRLAVAVHPAVHRTSSNPLWIPHESLCPRLACPASLTQVIGTCSMFLFVLNHFVKLRISHSPCSASAVQNRRCPLPGTTAPHARRWRTVALLPAHGSAGKAHTHVEGRSSVRMSVAACWTHSIFPKYKWDIISQLGTGAPRTPPTGNQSRVQTAGTVSTEHTVWYYRALALLG